MHRRLFLSVALGALATAASAAEFALDAQMVENAELPVDGRGVLDPVIVKAQVLLDRAQFSPGMIDGRDGDNFRSALRAFKMSRGRERSDALDAETLAELRRNSTDTVLMDYVTSDNDMKGPFAEKIPSRLEEMADLDHLGYTSPLEMLAEKFHMSEELLKALNPGYLFEKTGVRIMVANIGGETPATRAHKLEVDKAENSLKVLDTAGKILAFFPATVGSEERPAPSGTYKITRVARNPVYTYNPEYEFKEVRTTQPFSIKPGPNNPVGVVWIGLSKRGYGIHGTPDPTKVGKTSSHGCVRLTNWDALRLAQLVSRGTPVEFIE